MPFSTAAPLDALHLGLIGWTNGSQTCAPLQQLEQWPRARRDKQQRRALLFLSGGMAPQCCGDGGRLFAEERDEDAGAERDAGTVSCDHERGADADDAELPGR